MNSPLYICGPTASGKSALALTIAARLDGEIINGDAFQLYRGLETLAAAPSAGELKQVPHHLYSVLGTCENMDANRYLQLASPVIKEVQSRGKTPLIVGGSGLYLKFLTHGPSPIPAGDAAIRRELNDQSLEELAARLQQLDPAEAASMDLKNRRYLTRSIELCLLTGKPVSQLRRDWDRSDPPGLRGIYLDWPREELNARIVRRTEAMLSGDAIDEVRQLPPGETTASKAIGVAEIRALLAGDISREEAAERLTIATRQYAKRQRTWFRKEGWLARIERDTLPEDFAFQV